MRKLWFDLRESLRQAEKAVAEDATGTDEPPEPWLVLDANTARLWFTPANTPRPRSPLIGATHCDGPPPTGESWPLLRQPLTAPDTDGESVLDRLRSAAGRGHRWLVAETSTPPRLHTAAAYDIDTAPQAAIWTPAYLTVGDLGPYPGQVAHGYQRNGSILVRFTLETVGRIAADAQVRAVRFPRQAADLLVLCGDGTATRVFLVHAAVRPTDDLTRLTKSTTVARHVTADPDGWYRLTDSRWPWRQATPPTLPPSRSRRERHEPEVFEPAGPHGIKCMVCGATDYDIGYQELPSMAGYGTDITSWCRICGSSEAYAEEVGWSSRRAIWPPVLDPTAAAGGGEVTRP